MKWLAIAPGNERSLVIACEGIVTWHEVRSYARKAIGADCMVETADTAVHDVEIRWVGNDYVSPPSRRMQERRRTANGFGVWRDVS